MNRIYRVVWSTVRNAWVVACELATSRGKSRTAVNGSSACEHRWSRRVSPLRLAVLAGLFGVQATSHAADRYWDINRTLPGLGGAGTWDLSTTFWGADDDGVTGPYAAWSNAALDDAYFTGTGGAITLNTPITAHSLFFTANGYSLTGSTLTLAGVNPTITTNSNVTVSISSALAGTAGLIKNGAGALILTGTNTFSGGITVNAGNLSVDDNAALGALSNGITMAAGTSLSSSTSLSGRTVTLNGGLITLAGATGTARFTGAGGLDVTGGGVSLTDDTNDYTGQTRFRGNGSRSFTSIADLGVASSLGAPTDAALGTVVFTAQSNYGDTLSYLGDGDSSNRNWQIASGGGGAFPAVATLINSGTGTLRITGNIAGVGGITTIGFNANTADFELLGVISDTSTRPFSFAGSSTARSITLGSANTYAGDSSIGVVTVRAPVLADVGLSSSFGAGTGGGGGRINVSTGILSYTGAGASTNRPWTFNGGTIRNDGTGALTLTGNLDLLGNGATFGGSYTGGDNTVSGVIAGTGNLTSNGSGTWVLTGANTRSGAINIQSGTLRAGSASAFGTTTGITINNGTLDLNAFDLETPNLDGAGGTLALGGANLTFNGASAVTGAYGGSITGTGGIVKLGASTQTLSGSNLYTGDTTIGGGTLALNFSATGAPTADILSSQSTLNLGGGNLVVTGAAGENNVQTFDGVNITAGNNNISATSGSGGSMLLNLGAINRSGGLVDFDLPTDGFITTTSDALGGWATVNNGSSYAKIDENGRILAFTESDYTIANNPADWADGQFISDDSTGFNTPSTVDSPDGTLQLGGLRYTAARSTTLNIAGGDTLGIDGAILVTPTVGAFNQTIQGGSLTGMAGGGTLGIQQNSTGRFFINSQIVDNGGAIGFTKSGGGEVVLSNTNSTYTGATIVTQGTLEVASIANGGQASSIGQSSAASSNLVLEGAELRYAGGGETTDRGFTVNRSGSVANSTIGVANAAANLEFTGVVTGGEGAGLIKTGAGTLTLSNGANDYTGITSVNVGTLSITTLANGGEVSSIGASSSDSTNLVLSGGGRLQYTGGSVTSDRGFTLAGSGGVIEVTDLNSTLTLGGTATGTGASALRKEGAGTLVLAGTNTYTGATTVNAGVLRAGSEAAFGGPSLMTLADTAGVTLDLAGYDNKVGGLSGGGVSGGNVLLGDATLTIGGANASYSGTISGDGGLYKENSSVQTMVDCNHSYLGPTTIWAGTLRVDCLADGGAPSGIGASSSDASNLFLRGTLDYTGGDVTIDRGFQAATGTLSVSNAGATLQLDGQVTGTNFWKDGAGTLVLSNSSNAQTDYTGMSGGTLRAAASGVFGAGGLRFNGPNATVDLDGFDNSVRYLHTNVEVANQRILLNGANLTISEGGGTFSGAINGAGTLIKSGGSVQALSGCASNYSGSTTINGGWLRVTCLNDGGVDSSIGRSSSAPTNLIINAGLEYNGAGSSSDRQFTVGAAGATLSAAGTGAVNFTSTAPITFTGTNARTLTLRGSNTNDNTLSAQITDADSGVVRVTKTDDGTWVLGNETNTYTGITRIDGGVLAVTKLADGLQASSIGASSGAATNLVIGNGSTLRYTGATESSTNRQFTLSQGVTYIQSSGLGALKFTNTGNVTLAGSGDRTIALGGTNTGDNTMGGTIADASATGRTTLAKNDSGTWILTGNNTYTGNTVINAGNLMIGNGGNTGNAGAGNVIVDSAASTLSINRSDTFDFNGTLSGPGRLAQVGAGTTRLTSTSNSIGATTVSAGTLEVDGALSSSTFAMNGASTLNVDGTVQGANGAASTFTGDSGASTINVRTGGTLVASGDLGDGSDVLNLTGTLSTTAGVLNLGAGNDTFTLNDGAIINGLGVNAGAATTGDVLLLNNAAALTFNGGTTIGFETLLKQNSGVATMTGTQTFTAGTTIDAGTLDVDGTLQTSTVAVNNGATLNVDGAVQAATAALSDGAILNVAGTMQAAGGTPTAITGTAGANTIVIEQGAILRGSGDLGDGNDVLDVAGTLNTGGGTFSLGAGNDTFVVHDTTAVIGTLDAGAGDDMLNVNVSAGSVVPLGSTTGFESLGKSGFGQLAINGPSDFVDVQVQAGVLDVTSTGSIETHLATVSSGATLNVDGSLLFTAGADQFTIAGNVTGGGNVDMLDGDDVLTIQDGAAINIAIDAGSAVTGDIVTLDSAAALTFDGTNVTGFEQLVKQNAGTATLAGTHNYDVATINGGTLDVDGTLDAGTVALTDGATLNVDGVVRASAMAPTSLTGTAGVNIVAVGAGGNLLATGDLGDGADVLDVSGTLDTGGGTLSLGDGNDSFVIHDGTNVIGTVEGGAGLDTRVYDINLTADVGALSGFEGLTKTGTGVLNINGPGTSVFEQVEALGGTLNVAAGGAVDGVSSTSVGPQGTLQVDGTYSGTAGNDTFTAAGTVSGAGTIDLGDGDDVLTIQDGAALNMVIDGGAANDTVALDSASALTFAGAEVSGFERLLKQNVGTATLVGVHSYDNTTVEGGTLDVEGVVETGTLFVNDGTTLRIDGTVQALGAAQTAITGSAGVDTVVVNAGGSLLATGDLGEGDDVLDVAGTLDTGAGALSLGDGDDSFVIHDGTIVLGTVAGGAGVDTRVYDITGTAQLGALQEFEGLTKRNTGTLTITGPAATTGLLEVAVEGGTLGIEANGNVTGVQTATVAAGATLNVDGDFGFTLGGDTFTVAGNVAGRGSIDMLDGDDQLTLLDGADLSGLATALEGGAGHDTLTLDVDSAARLGGATGFETLIKQGNGAATIAGPAGSRFDTVLVRAGVLEVAVGAVVDPVTTVVDAGATMMVDGIYNGTADADTFTLSGTLAGSGTIDLLAGDDVLTINTGSDVSFSGVFDANAATADRFVLAGAGADAFDASLIGAVFQNFDEFRKEGTGTWRLTGSGAQHWTVAEGTLIGDSTSLAGDIDNAATVIFDQATDGSYAGVLSGSGTLIKQNTGTLAMTATHAFAGDTQIQSGTLEVDGVLPGTVTVGSGGTLSGVGMVMDVRSLAGGFVAPGTSANPFGTLTIAGNYDGAGAVRINTELGNESSPTSRLVIQGNVSGASTVVVSRAGGNGAATAGDGIEIIQVDGASAADSFRLARPVQAGAYEYLLYQGGAADANDWYLRSELIDPDAPIDPEQPPTPAFRPGAAGYVLGHQANLEYGFSALGNLRARVGDQGRVTGAESDNHAADAWMRVYAHELDISGARFETEDLKMSTVHFGTDVYSHQVGKASVHLGVMASVGESTATFFDAARSAAGLAPRAGEVESDVIGGGLYWTRHGGGGGYLDLTAQLLHYRNRYQDQYLAASHQSGWGGTLSAEIGKAFALGGKWLLEPQLQLAYQRLELGDFTDEVSAVSAVDEDALRGRAALQLLRAPSRWLGMDDASPYIGVGVQRDFRDADSIMIGSTTLGEEIPDTTGDASVGFTGSVRPGIELHLDLRYQKSTEGERDGVRGNFGFRMTF
ncbi:autotransporter outer membrane beta-barrel domain-containing protein [Steroidobacter sp. S1-65]|uniref:Autotransporter outer membrane beta-barrel domain-containing protein n=1 Tax=Steroidobacter gossypii TaxID=2805490 RepID=A0ABS1WZE1_9GAMM|nr:autotransporter outer membrane beta-barrel domain-containing protein [Steroidobacter gossypii]MBM0106341.1 autotransporter outer membrane beta-barrel domain-containing protein [Steroidobacter gossypii]